MPPLLLPILLELVEWLVAGVVVGSVITRFTQPEAAASRNPLPAANAPGPTGRRYRIRPG